MRVIVTGSRDWTNRPLLRRVLETVLNDIDDDEPLIIMHGACPTGADSHAHQWACEAQDHGYDVTPNPWPADWETHGRAAGPIRNGQMVRHGADLCLAFLQPGEPNKGTKGCIRLAEKAGIPVERYPKDGTDVQS